MEESILATIARHERAIESLRRGQRDHEQRIAAVEADRADAPGHDPRDRRKRLLRRAWRVHYAGSSRDGAARAIALDWRAYVEARSNAEADPGTREAIFARLAEGGCAPVGHRTIYDDLDVALDR